MPSPQPTLRWLLASPVPTQIVLGFLRSIVTVPIEYEPSFWKTGVKVVPALVVFQTPPDATPMYHVCLSSGCTATTLTRPDISAGPTARKRSSLNVPDAQGSWLPRCAACRWPAERGCCPAWSRTSRRVAEAAATADRTKVSFFMRGQIIVGARLRASRFGGAGFRLWDELWFRWPRCRCCFAAAPPLRKRRAARTRPAPMKWSPTGRSRGRRPATSGARSPRCLRSRPIASSSACAARSRRRIRRRAASTARGDRRGSAPPNRPPRPATAWSSSIAPAT